MPYSVQKHGRQWAVVNTATKEIKAKSTSKKKAEDQAKLLRSIEHNWKSTGEKDTYTRKINGRNVKVRLYASSGKNRMTELPGEKENAAKR